MVCECAAIFSSSRLAGGNKDAIHASLFVTVEEGSDFSRPVGWEAFLHFRMWVVNHARPEASKMKSE